MVLLYLFNNKMSSIANSSQKLTLIENPKTRKDWENNKAYYQQKFFTEKQKKDEKTMKGQFEHMMKLQEKCKELKTSLVGGGASEGEVSMVGKKKKGTAIDDKDKEIEELKDRLLQAEKNKEIYQK